MKIEELKKEIERLEKEKKEMLKSKEYEELQKNKDEIKKLKDDIKKLKAKIDISSLKRVLKKFLRENKKYKEIVDDFLENPLKNSDLKIVDVLEKLSIQISDGTIKDKNDKKILERIKKLDKSNLSKVFDDADKKNARIKELSKKISDNDIKDKIKKIDLDISSHKSNIKILEDEIKSKELKQYKKCPKCGEDIDISWNEHKKCGWVKEKEEESKDTQKARVLVFVSPTCPHCPAALNMAKEIENERDDVKVIEYNTGTPKGQKKAIAMQVMSVPTIFVKGPDDPQFIGFKSTPIKAELNKSIDLALGKEEWKKPEGFISGMLKKLGLKK